MRAPSEIDPHALRALRGVSLRDLGNLYSNGTYALWNPELSDSPPPAWETASRLHGVKHRLLITLTKAHRGLGCLRPR